MFPTPLLRLPTGQDHVLQFLPELLQLLLLQLFPPPAVFTLLHLGDQRLLRLLQLAGQFLRRTPDQTLIISGEQNTTIGLVAMWDNKTVGTFRSSCLLLCWLSPTSRLRLCSVWTSSASRSFSLLLLWRSICSKVKHKQLTQDESPNEKNTITVKSEHAIK